MAGFGLAILSTPNAAAPTTTFNIALPTRCPKCSKVHSSSHYQACTAPVKGRDVGGGIVYASTMDMCYPQFHDSLDAVQKVLIRWRCFSNYNEVLAMGDGDFDQPKTEFLLRRAIQKLVGEAPDSLGDAVSSEARFFCDVLLAFEKDMGTMRSMWEKIGDHPHAGASISPFQMGGMTFYLVCTPDEDVGTSAQTSNNEFMRHYMESLATLYAFWKRSISGVAPPPAELCGCCSYQEQ